MSFTNEGRGRSSMLSSGRQTNSSSYTTDRKQVQDRFARPPSMHFSRYGQPCVGLPERPSKRILRHEVEAKISSQPGKVSRRMMVSNPGQPMCAEPARKTKRGFNPTYATSPELLYSKPTGAPSQKKARVSQRYAAREQFESAILARRQAQEHSSNFMSTRAACLEMERISWRSQNCSRRRC